MINYGEELAYWYLRFNGFFIITNFVLHRYPELDNDSNKNCGYRGDVDLLAIRPSGVQEIIWYTRGDELESENLEVDEEFFGELLCDGEDINSLKSGKTIGAVVEVKAGMKNRGDSNNLKIFRDKDRLKKALERLGMYKEDLECERWCVRRIENNSEENSKIIVKILFDNDNSDKITKEKTLGYLHIPLKHARNFIFRRLKKYSDEKCGSWVYFQSPLLQYMIWELNNGFVVQ